MPAMRTTYSTPLQTHNLKNLRRALCGRGKALREACQRKTHAGYRAIVAFSLAYADQNEKDHTALNRAVRAGKVKVVFEEEKSK